MKVAAYVISYGDLHVASAIVAGLRIEVEAPTQQEAIDKLAFKIMDSTEPKFVELDLAAYAREYPNRDAPPAPPVIPKSDEHPIELARRAQSMRVSGLTDEQIAAKLGGVSVVFVQNLIATLEKLSPNMLRRITPDTK